MEFDVQMRLLLPMRHVTSLHISYYILYCTVHSAARTFLKTVAQATIARSAALRVCLGLTLRQAARTRLQGGGGR